MPDVRGGAWVINGVSGVEMIHFPHAGIRIDEGYVKPAFNDIAPKESLELEQLGIISENKLAHI
jgi:hypothetical protein